MFKNKHNQLGKNPQLKDLGTHGIGMAQISMKLTLKLENYSLHSQLEGNIEDKINI